MHSDIGNHKAQPSDQSERGGTDNLTLSWPSDFSLTEKKPENSTLKNQVILEMPETPHCIHA